MFDFRLLKTRFLRCISPVQKLLAFSKKVSPGLGGRGGMVPGNPLFRTSWTRWQPSLNALLAIVASHNGVISLLVNSLLVNSLLPWYFELRQQHITLRLFIFHCRIVSHWELLNAVRDVCCVLVHHIHAAAGTTP